MPVLLLCLFALVYGCATAVIPAKVKYVPLYEVPQPGLPSEGQGAVASLHTGQLKLYLPNNRPGGHPSKPICFRLVPGQDHAASPYLVQWESLKACGGGLGVDDSEDRVTAQMGGMTEEEYSQLFVVFPSNSKTHPFPSGGCLPSMPAGSGCIEMTMDISIKELNKMYVVIYPRAQADLWDLLDGIQVQ